MFHRRRLIYGPKDPKIRKVQPFKFFPELIFSPQYPKRLRRLTGDLEFKGAEVTTNKSEYLLNDKKIEEIYVNVLVDEISDILHQVDRYIPKEEISGKGKSSVQQMGPGSPPVGKGRPKVLRPVPQSETSSKTLEKDRENRLLGLFGELFVISQSTDVIKTMSAWRIKSDDPFDFSNEQAMLEVKTTTWPERRHYFTHKQCTPDHGVRAIVVSIITRRVGIGKSINDLQTDLVRKVPDKLVDKLKEAISQEEFTEKNLAAKFDKVSAQNSLRYFDLSEIPAVRKRPPDVTGIKFWSDLKDAKYLKIGEIVSSCPDFLPLLPKETQIGF